LTQIKATALLHEDLVVRPLPTGGLLLGDTVRLTAGFSAVKEA
jgi:hypothetical protein